MTDDANDRSETEGERAPANAAKVWLPAQADRYFAVASMMLGAAMDGRPEAIDMLGEFPPLVDESGAAPIPVPSLLRDMVFAKALAAYVYHRTGRNISVPPGPVAAWSDAITLDDETLADVLRSFIEREMVRNVPVPTQWIDEGGD